MTKLVLNLKDNEDDEDVHVYEEDDLILCKTRDGHIRSCGFSVNNMLLTEGKSPMMTMNRHDDGDGNGANNKVSDLFQNLAIPAGFFYIQAKSIPYRNSDNRHCMNEGEGEVEEEDIREDLYERLLALASVDGIGLRKKKGTKKAPRTHGAKQSRKQHRNQ